MKTNIIKCCTDLGTTYDGAHLGPNVIGENLKNKNIIKKYEIDKDNIEKSREINNLAKNMDSINNFTKKHFSVVTEIINNDCFPLTVGGDHSIAIGSILASNTKNKDLGVIWIDAHGDYNNFESTETGNIHGFPLAAATDYKCDKLTNFLDCTFVNPKKCVIVGARSIDKLELANIKNAGVNLFTIEDIRKFGIEKIMNKAFDIAGEKVHISYDLDAIDPEYAPGVSTAEDGGINLDEAYKIVDIICDNIEKIKSFDLVEYNPTNDIDDKTCNIAITILNKVINQKEKN